VKATVLNSLEKRSFYSFLSLYIGSSLLFVMLSGYWYYTAQKNAIESNTYYKLRHLSEQISSAIINAQMRGTTLQLPTADEGFSYALISTDNQLVKGELLPEISADGNAYYEKNGHMVLVSDGPLEHLNIKYVVVQTSQYHTLLRELQLYVIMMILLISAVIIFVAWILSKIFMRPIHQKVQQIEQFIQDISHELNTPITALQMSSKRALQKKVYDEKVLTNISISTKQLYSIYQSLVYLNFNTPDQKAVPVDLRPLLEETITFYTELAQAKRIGIETDLIPSHLTIVPERARLLFSNLLSNAIKYSMPETTITVTLKEEYFSIKDEGVGIDEKKLKKIFRLYERSSDIAGGFGVGLSIVAQICQEFDIKIEVVSTLGEGSTFTLRWREGV